VTVIEMAMFCGCASAGGGEAAEQVSYNADINVCMLVNCFFCTIGGCYYRWWLLLVARVIVTAMCVAVTAPGRVRQWHR